MADCVAHPIPQPLKTTTTIIKSEETKNNEKLQLLSYLMSIRKEFNEDSETDFTTSRKKRFVIDSTLKVVDDFQYYPLQFPDKERASRFLSMYEPQIKLVKDLLWKKATLWG